MRKACPMQLFFLWWERIHILNKCKQLASDPRWEVLFIHVYREGNRAVYWYANHRVEQVEKITIYPNPPLELSSIMEEDIRGVAWPRLVVV